MLSQIPNLFWFPAAILIAFIISVYSVRKIIFITRKRKLYDVPDNVRKIHGQEIPSLGGVGIFTGFMATALFFAGNGLQGWPYLIISCVVLFFTGVYDDIMNMRPSKKLVAQLLASFLTIVCADIRLHSMYGLFGVGELSYWVSVLTTTLLCTFFINVFNFIDGIDGLACMSAMLYTLATGIGLLALHQFREAFIAFSLFGATGGLLWFNYPPAKIYMGDTGSMLSGFCVFILSLLFVRAAEIGALGQGGLSSPAVGLIMVFALLFFPVYDAVRVFILRVRSGVSPLKADRLHLHYLLIDGGMSHVVAGWLLVAVNLITVLLVMAGISLMPLLIVFLALPIPSIAATIFATRLSRKQ